MNSCVSREHRSWQTSKPIMAAVVTNDARHGVFANMATSRMNARRTRNGIPKALKR